MNEYKIKITKVSEGYVTIAADTPAEALKEAELRFNVMGEELPDMEDTQRLMLSIDREPQKVFEAEKKEGPVDKDEVVAYLKAQGHPHPDLDGTLDEFLNPDARQVQYHESVRNNYFIGDVDRWFHLMDILGDELSFRAAMFIENSLYEEDFDSMDVNSVSDILDTPMETLRNRLKEMAENVLSSGELPENEHGITAQDVSYLVHALNLEESFSQAHETMEQPKIEEPDAKVYIEAGSVKREIYSGSIEECEQFCEDLNWVYKDENEFVWDLVFEDLREENREGKPEFRIFHCTEADIAEYGEAIKFWSNACGELHHHGKYMIAEADLPAPLRRAYQELWTEDSGSLCYLVETKKGYGIALINEYSEEYAKDCGLSMDEMFSCVMRDSGSIGADDHFMKADIYVSEHLGILECHEIVVVFPADIPENEFEAAVKRLDELSYQASEKAKNAKKKVGLQDQIKSAAARTGEADGNPKTKAKEPDKGIE